ncbi:MAG: hypothetical protein Ct9H300mP16_03990 [Pseudomonadota bacterium]|nr:MAG: hypothetical protein Ct9H300mP16_03990 [Pseudomonadota bacterium]
MTCPSKSGKKAKPRKITRGGVPFRWDKISGGQLQDLMIAGMIAGKGRYAYVGEWGELGTGNSKFKTPMDLAVDTKGNVLWPTITTIECRSLKRR